MFSPHEYKITNICNKNKSLNGVKTYPCKICQPTTFLRARSESQWWVYSVCPQVPYVRGGHCTHALRTVVHYNTLTMIPFALYLRWRYMGWSVVWGDGWCDNGWRWTRDAKLLLSDRLINTACYRQTEHQALLVMAMLVVWLSPWLHRVEWSP